MSQHCATCGDRDCMADHQRDVPDRLDAIERRIHDLEEQVRSLSHVVDVRSSRLVSTKEGQNR